MTLIGQWLLKCQKRTAVLIGSFADVWCLAGGKETLVAAADDTWTQFNLNLSEDVVHLGAVKSPSLEKLLASQPDLVIGSTKTAADVELKSTLEEMEIPVIYFDVSSFEDYLRMLKVCTMLTGYDEYYQMYGTDVATQVEDAKKRITGRKTQCVVYSRIWFQL